MGIWAVVDKIYIANIIGVGLFRAAAYLMVIIGGILMVVSLLGALGTFREKRGLVVFVSSFKTQDQKCFSSLSFLIPGARQFCAINAHDNKIKTIQSVFMYSVAMETLTETAKMFVFR